jgi:hypothetical protein
MERSLSRFRGQTPLEATARERADLIAFLKAL